MFPNRSLLVYTKKTKLLVGEANVFTKFLQQKLFAGANEKTFEQLQTNNMGQATRDQKRTLRCHSANYKVVNLHNKTTRQAEQTLERHSDKENHDNCFNKKD